MRRHAEYFNTHQRERFLRPDAARWIRPPHPDERKYSPDQARDEQGRWTDSASGNVENNDDSALVPDILSQAEKLSLTGSPADYRICLNLCYPILERFSSPKSDRNTFDFHKCMNACLGLNR